MKFNKVDPYFFSRLFIALLVFITCIGWTELLPADSTLQKFIGLFLIDLRNGYAPISNMIATNSATFLLPLKTFFSPYLWVLLFFYISVVFVKDKRPAFSSGLIYLGCFILGSSAGGRRIGFDVLGYILLPYFIASLLITSSKIKKIFQITPDTIDRFRWHCALSGPTVVYSSSAFAKLYQSGLSWVDSSKIALLLKWQNYFSSRGYLVFDSSPYFPDFLHQPHFLSTLLSAMTLGLEFFSFLAPLSETLLMFGVVLILYLQVGLGFVTGIWLPIFIPILMLISLYIWAKVKRPQVELSKKSRLLAFLICCAILLLTWLLPKEPRSDRRFVWPFATFSMFSNQTNFISIFEFLDHNSNYIDIEKIVPSSKTNTVMLQMPLDHKTIRAQILLCDLFLAPDSLFFKTPRSFSVVERRLWFDKNEVLNEKLMPVEFTEELCLRFRKRKGFYSH